MTIDQRYFEEWMQRFMERFDRIESLQREKPVYTLDGEKLLDNTDLCFMLHVSKRTLQRFRTSGLLPYRRIRQKTYYIESDVQKFIREHLLPANNENKQQD